MADERRPPQGFDRLVRELGAVYRRRSLTRKRSLTRARRLPLPRRHLRDEALPIFACVEDPLDLGTPDRTAKPGQHALPVVLALLSDHLKPAGESAPQRQVPHAVVPLEDKSPADGPDAALKAVSFDDLGELVKLLDRATVGLNVSLAGGYDFARYDLVRWLMQASFPDTKPRRRTQLRRALYRRALGGGSGGEDQAADGLLAKLQDQLPSWLRVLSLWLIPAFFWLRHSGRVPVLGGPYRWLRGQSYVPRGDDGFFDLGLRLTADHWDEQDPEWLAGLLVGAFLEDLRSGFRPAVWFGRYRATHPILMVGPISRTNGGYLLVRMVAAVRNDTQRFDPLLLVTAGRKVPPLAGEPESSPNESLAEWRARQHRESLRRRIGAWLLIFSIGSPRVSRRPRRTAPPAVQPELPDRLENVPGPLLRKPQGRWPVLALVLMLIAGSYLGFGVLQDRRHCGGGELKWQVYESATATVTKVDGDCVGVTDGTNALLFPSQSFAPVRAKILEQNKRAAELSQAQPERPVATLVFMASADDRSLDAGVFTAEREQLAGLAVAQAVQLNKPEQRYEPILRVLIANAGPRFKHAARVAEQIGRLAAGDPTIVAVVGMTESRRSTQEMIQRLAAAGLPTVAATLTADSMVDVSRMYLQVSPQNRREAAVAGAYVRKLLATGKDPFGRPLERRATVYKSDDPNDTYSQNLAKDVQLELTAAGVPVVLTSYSPSGGELDANRAGRDACDRRGIVFFAGRGQVDFESFLGGVQDRCRANAPYILAGDDVTKWAADRSVSARNRSVAFQYLALSLAPDLLAAAPPESSDFYARLADLFPYETTDRGRSLDGHAALSYDAAYSVVLAVSYLRRDSIAVNGGTVWSALQSITDAAGAQRAYQGVTGRIDYGGSVLRRVPVNKPVAVVTFQNGRPVPAATVVCGARAGSPAWCPVDAAPPG
ncbi:hypothetical protein GCM10009804_73150 [Kribbella hippodromi]|uniref:ABC-type branched-chain amino acid transport system, substrate-binding protein n=1 Tax=Kribbella hippodromi TaxID=434347 RepID=A0ABN2EG13_9ACTN